MEIQLRIQVSKNCLLIEYHYASIKMFKSEEINVGRLTLYNTAHND